MVVVNLLGEQRHYDNSHKTRSDEVMYMLWPCRKPLCHGLGIFMEDRPLIPLGTESSLWAPRYQSSNKTQRFQFGFKKFHLLCAGRSWQGGGGTRIPNQGLGSGRRPKKKL